METVIGPEIDRIDKFYEMKPSEIIISRCELVNTKLCLNKCSALVGVSTSEDREPSAEFRIVVYREIADATIPGIPTPAEIMKRQKDYCSGATTFNSLELLGTSRPVRVSKGLHWTDFTFPSLLNLDTGSSGSMAFWIGVQASPEEGTTPIVSYVGTKRSNPFTMRISRSGSLALPPPKILFDRKSFFRDGDVVVLAFHTPITKVLLRTFINNAWLRLRSNEMTYMKREKKCNEYDCNHNNTGGDFDRNKNN